MGTCPQDNSLTRKPSLITEDHFRAFGAIVHQFARFEVLIGIIINRALGGRQFGVTAIAISGLSYSQKSDALKTLLKIVSFPQTQNEIIIDYVISFNCHSALRNDIAHRIWNIGTRPGSIKAIEASSRGGKIKIRGTQPDELRLYDR
jgi:hypothetical protein